MPEYQGPEKIVIRRYSDFVWLRDRLFEKYKGIFIPPLPEKSAVGKFASFALSISFEFESFVVNFRIQYLFCSSLSSGTHYLIESKIRIVHLYSLCQSLQLSLLDLVRLAVS